MEAEDAVRQAYEAHYRRLVTQVFGLVGELAEAEDAVHEAFARVLAAPRSFLEAEDAERWLRVAALNIARTRYRRRWLFDRLVRSGRVEVAPPVPGISGDRVALVAALRRLAPPTREVVVLHHVADLPVAEVAVTLGIPVGTVKARLARGRTALARLLSDEESTPLSGEAPPASSGGEPARLSGEEPAPLPREVRHA
ncbi:RNA polymerase sigma factor [Catenuloplanes atrovinosus]|uniref:RNA polymerase sigma-70 factor (ECF subfamily) n=1 Tax=Catenuloplanes atrovinosus TaxID=137266 RepID=A0AAE3YHT4_9ACTN|nr:sigma factor-like helix-turn-helix DNA-binding protein [Catenuloplanes atrovinosus]MDR7274193.1 RNA polymerase sigma-70 factor (ECF subfamily) [Catenuloplanes atrovinosus]